MTQIGLYAKQARDPAATVPLPLAQRPGGVSDQHALTSTRCKIWERI